MTSSSSFMMSAMMSAPGSPEREGVGGEAHLLDFHYPAGCEAQNHEVLTGPPSDPLSQILLCDLARLVTIGDLPKPLIRNVVLEGELALEQIPLAAIWVAADGERALRIRLDIGDLACVARAEEHHLLAITGEPDR